MSIDRLFLKETEILAGLDHRDTNREEQNAIAIHHLVPNRAALPEHVRVVLRRGGGKDDHLVPGVTEVRQVASALAHGRYA